MKKIEKGRINFTMAQKELDETKSQLLYTKGAISKLRKYFEITTIDDLRKYGKLSYLSSYMEESEKEYLGGKFVPKPERERIHAQYVEILTDLSDSCNVIENAFNMPFKVSFDGTQLIADEDEIRAHFEQKYYTELTEDDCTYYNVLSKVFCALDESDKWEREHSYYNYTRLGAPINSRDFNIYSMWQRSEFSADAFRNMIGGLLGKIKKRGKEMEDETMQE